MSVNFNKSGAGDVSGVKSTGSSSESPGPTSRTAAQNQLELQCQGIQHSSNHLGDCTDTCCIYIHADKIHK